MTDHALGSETAAANGIKAALDLSPITKRAGIPYPTSGSPGLAKHYRLHSDEPIPEDRKDLGDLAWAVSLALNGLLPTVMRPTSNGTVLLLEFPTFLDGESDATAMKVVVEVRQADAGATLHLSLPEELPLPKPPLVLMIEDDDAVARTMCLFLRRRGFDVLVRNHGKGVSELARQEQPDAIVLDVDLPDMSGLDICRQLRADPNVQHIPVVFCSGNYAAREPALQLGAADFLEKPTQVLQLPERLHTILAHRPTADKTKPNKKS